MDLIHDDPQYQGVWVLYQNHNGYYQGPTYEHELKALKEALKPRAVESDSQIPQKPTESGLRECMACGLKTDTKTCLDAFCGANTRPVFSTPATDQSTNGKAMSEEGGAA